MKTLNAYSTSVASHDPTPLRLRVRPLVASLGIALALGVAENALAEAALFADLNASRPWSGMSGSVHGPMPVAQATPNSLPSRATVGGTSMVQNCADSGAGSLRATISSAPNDATIGFADLACSTITLTSGAIAIAQQSLHIQGPGRDTLEINGNNVASVFRHAGSGTFSIHDLTIANGHYQAAPQHAGEFGGGCVFSQASLELSRVTVEDCSVDVDVGPTQGTTRVAGGGVLAFGPLSLDRTIIRHCEVYANALGAPGVSLAWGGGAAKIGYEVSETTTVSDSLISGNVSTSSAAAQGGGLFVQGALHLIRSTIDNNSAIDTDGHYAVAGGLRHVGNLEMRDSTISNNHAAGGAGMTTRQTYGSQVITNSTVSGNTSSVGLVGGISCSGHCVVSNTTIAFNEAAQDQDDFSSPVAGGLAISGNGELQSVLIAGNQAAGQPADFSFDFSGSVTGADNLVLAPLSTPPADTIVGQNPLLAPLANNGGPTTTHALLPGSPALETGNNDAGIENDQRGAGFPRVVGANPDIGAFELAPNVIFHNGFD